MPDVQHLWLFVVAGWLLALSPGPDVLYIVGNSLRGGARAGLVAVAGITAGCFVHVAAAALGVSALLATSAMAFTVLKWLGAAYLCWIGIKLLASRAPQVALDARPVPAEGRKSIFAGGFWSNVLNPKVALFFLAFVPQFIDPAAGHKPLVFVALGLLFIVNSLPITCGWALGAAWLSRRTAIQHGMHWLDRAAGAMFVGFGLKLALAENPNR